MICFSIKKLELTLTKTEIPPPGVEISVLWSCYDWDNMISLHWAEQQGWMRGGSATGLNEGGVQQGLRQGTYVKGSGGIREVVSSYSAM